MIPNHYPLLHRMGVIELDVSCSHRAGDSLPMGTKEKSFQVACPLIVSRVTVHQLRSNTRISKLTFLESSSTACADV